MTNGIFEELPLRSPQEAEELVAETIGKGYLANMLGINALQQTRYTKARLESEEHTENTL